MRPTINKSALFTLILILVLSGIYWYRKTNSLKLVALQGETMGTTYNIKYLQQNPVSFQKEIDSVLVLFSQSLSTYENDSEISAFNRDSVFVFKLSYFYPVLKKSKEVFEKTGGFFDPTVMPLVKAWGFGPNKKDTLPPEKIDSLLQFVGMDKLVFDEKQVSKTKKGVQLDFNAIAQGYGVDVVAELLEQKGIKDYMVEIGGEVLAKGINQEGEGWKIGVDDPRQSERMELKAIVSLENRALVTSGNYRKFYVKDGKRYVHTINPKTGYPEMHSLLSATVFAKDCMTADAYATAFMVMGFEKTLEFIKKEKDLEVYLIYDDKGTMKTYISEGLKPYLKEAE